MASSSLSWREVNIPLNKACIFSSVNLWFDSFICFGATFRASTIRNLSSIQRLAARLCSRMYSLYPLVAINTDQKSDCSGEPVYNVFFMDDCVFTIGIFDGGSEWGSASWESDFEPESELKKHLIGGPEFGFGESFFDALTDSSAILYSSVYIYFFNSIKHSSAVAVVYTFGKMSGKYKTDMFIVRWFWLRYIGFFFFIPFRKICFLVFNFLWFRGHERHFLLVDIFNVFLEVFNWFFG